MILCLFCQILETHQCVTYEMTRMVKEDEKEAVTDLKSMRTKFLDEEKRRNLMELFMFDFNFPSDCEMFMAEMVEKRRVKVSASVEKHTCSYTCSHTPSTIVNKPFTVIHLSVSYCSFFTQTYTV